MSAVDRFIRECRREVRSLCVEVNGKMEDAILVSDFDRIADDYVDGPRKKISPVRRFKPCSSKVVEDGVIRYSDGRERCDSSKAGRREYHHRTIQMLERQEHRCAWCGQFLSDGEATFDHEAGRTSGHIDERIWTDDGKPQNASLHGRCNLAKGSTRAPYPFQAEVVQGA